MRDFVNFTAGMNEYTVPGVPPEAVLVNVPQNAGSMSQIRQTVKLFEQIHPRYTMLDSGGYQLLSRELSGAEASYDGTKSMKNSKDHVNLAPPHIIEAVLRLNPNICTSLDLPVLKIRDNIYEQDLEFMRKLGFNLVWMRETALLCRKHCPQVELFIPVQCYAHYQFIYYIEPFLSELPFNGLSLPTRNAKAPVITLFFIRFFQIGVRKVHLLSVANFWELALAAYFARNVFNWTSVDATTWRLAADKHRYLDPNTLCQIFVGDKAVFNDGERTYCGCPWCSGLSFSEIKNMPEAARMSFLRCHNHYVIQKAGRDFYDNAEDLLIFEKYLKYRNPTRTKMVDDLIHALRIATYMRDVDMNVLEKMLFNY